MAAHSASGKAVGTVEFAVGEVKAIASDGTVRILQVGDRVFAQEVIATSANAVVQVHLENGSMFDLGRDSTITLDDDFLGGRGSAAPVATVPQDADQLQPAIAAGADSSQRADATAAGPEMTAATGEEKPAGEHALVIVEQPNATGEVTSGFAMHSAAIGSAKAEPGMLSPQEGAAFLVQAGPPLFPVRDASPVVTGHESRVTGHEIMANSDKLALSDLLQGEPADAGNLTAYLHFNYDSGTNTTTVEVKTHGAAGAVEQKIVLAGVDLTAGGTLTSDSAIIQHLLTHAKLHTDV